METQEAIELLEQRKNLICHDCIHPAMVGWCENHCKIPKAFDMAVNALKKQIPVDPALYGYNLEHLIAFALACRRAGVDEDDLKTFANNLDFAFQIASEGLRRLQMEAAAKVMGGE